MVWPFRENAPWTRDDLEMRVLNGQPPAGFDCGDESYNRFLYSRAWRDQKRGVTVTHLLRIKGIPAAYVTLTMDKIRLGPSEKPKGVSWQFVGAVKVAQLAVAKPFAGFGLGAFLLAYVVEYARDPWRDRLPLRDAGRRTAPGRMVPGAGLRSEPRGAGIARSAGPRAGARPRVPPPEHAIRPPRPSRGMKRTLTP